MIDAIYEFRKGVLFVRLEGELIKKTYKKIKMEIDDIICNGGITNLVFNLENLTDIDLYGVNTLIYNSKLVKKNFGKSFVCGINKKIRKVLENNKIFNYLIKIDDEISIFSIVN